MGKKLFVGNLSFETKSADLETLFAQAGTCDRPRSSRTARAGNHAASASSR